MYVEYKNAAIKIKGIVLWFLISIMILRSVTNKICEYKSTSPTIKRYGSSDVYYLLNCCSTLYAKKAQKR